MSKQSAHNQRADAPAARAPALPDLNAQTYPFEVVQHLIDQSALINGYAIPDSDRSNSHNMERSRSAGSIELSETLYRFGVSAQPSESGHGVRAVNIVSDPLGRFTHLWTVIPDDFAASPGRNPSPSPLDPSRSQRFVMQDGVFTFGRGADGFRGFGTGRTYPMRVNGRQLLLVAAVGEVIDGYGKFKSLEGSYVLSGEITAGGGFKGNIQCRVTDPGGRIRTESELTSFEGTRGASSSLTYIMFRGQKKDERAKTSYVFGSNGEPQGFKLKQELRAIHLDSILIGGRELRSSARLGQVIGRMSSQVFLNILNPGAPGTSLAPIPFSSYNEFTFTDDDGNTIGSFAAEGGEGRTFNVKLAGAPGQKALRFGAFQTLAKGTGCFDGVQGLLTDNSIVGIAPHVTSTLYVACICDPEGRYRVGAGRGER